MCENIKQWEIYSCDIADGYGSEQDGFRPVLILQNDKGNLHSSTTIVAIITSKSKKSLPTHVNLKPNKYNSLRYDSTVELEQVRTVDKSRLKNKIGCIGKRDISNVQKALNISLGM